MITAADLMTRDVMSVAPDDKVADVAQIILKNRISSLPVVGPKREVLGMVSEGDLIRSAETAHKAHRSKWLVLLTSPLDETPAFIGNKDRTVADVMSRDVLMASEDETLPRLIDLLSTSRIKRLPIVRGRKLSGIVSRVDVLRYLATTFLERVVQRLDDQSAIVGAAVGAEMSALWQLLLQITDRIDYIGVVGLPTMAINAVRNRRSGPGGSTRRLHQTHGFPWKTVFMGAKQARRA